MVIFLFSLLALIMSTSVYAEQLYYGDCIRLKNNAAECYLHYEKDASIYYLKDLSNNQATGDYNTNINPFDRYNGVSWWRIRKNNSSINESFGSPVQSGDIILLEHVSSKNYLATIPQSTTTLSKLPKIECTILDESEENPAASSAYQWIIESQEPNQSIDTNTLISLASVENKDEFLATTSFEHTSKHRIRTGGNREIACRKDLQPNAKEKQWSIDAIFSMQRFYKKSLKPVTLLVYRREDFGIFGIYNNQHVYTYSNQIPKILHINTNTANDAITPPNKYLAAVSYKPELASHKFILNQDLADTIKPATRISTSLYNSVPAGYLHERYRGNRCDFVSDIKDESLWEVIPVTSNTFKLRQKNNKKYLERQSPSFLQSKKYPEDKESWTTLYAMRFYQGSLFSLAQSSNITNPPQSVGGSSCLCKYHDNSLLAPYFSEHWKVKDPSNFTIEFTGNARNGICVAISTQKTLFPQEGNAEFLYIVFRQQKNTVAVSIFDNNLEKNVASGSHTQSEDFDPIQRFWIKMSYDTLTFGIGQSESIEQNTILKDIRGNIINYSLKETPRGSRFIGFSGFSQDVRISKIMIDGSIPAKDETSEKEKSEIEENDNPKDLNNQSDKINE